MCEQEKNERKMFRTSFDEEHKLWYGPKMKMDWVHETSMGSKILHSLKSNGPKVAQVKSKLNSIKLHGKNSELLL